MEDMMNNNINLLEHVHMEKQVQHEDFGAKNGGAKKELWKKRGLIPDDLKRMNSREADKYVKKKNIWKKPDYQAMIDSGMPVDVAFFIKTVRDSLPVSPVYVWSDDTSELRARRQAQYIDTVREIQSVMENVKTKADAMMAFSQFYIDNRYMEYTAEGMYPRYIWTEKGKNNPTIASKLVKALYVSSDKIYDRDFVRKAAEKQFGTSKEGKVPRGYNIYYNDGKKTYSLNYDWKLGTYYVTNSNRIIKKNLESREAALKWVQEFAQQRNANGKKKFVPEPLKQVKREGTDYRCGKDTSGQDYLDTFGFKGGEFGNWMNQNDRQVSLNMGYDALKDLAAALKINDRDISYQGILSIAFGARGSGSAAAHYEPLRQVINLTKMKGAGSLAHEWWHGLDDYLGAKMGVSGMLSEKPYKYSLFKKLIEVIKYKPETPEQAAARQEVQKVQTILHESVSSEPVIGRVPTEYYKNSIRMGKIFEKDNGYWDCNTELTARAFATYTRDTLTGRSDYLTGHAECAIIIDNDRDGNMSILKAYPQGEERRAINAVFDEIVADLKLKNYLSHDENTLPETSL